MQIGDGFSLENLAHQLESVGLTDEKSDGLKLLTQIFRRICQPKHFTLPKCSIVNNGNDFSYLLDQIDTKFLPDIFKYLLQNLGETHQMKLCDKILIYEILAHPKDFSRNNTPAAVLIKTITHQFGGDLFKHITKPAIERLEKLILKCKDYFRVYSHKKVPEQENEEVLKALQEIFGDLFDLLQSNQQYYPHLLCYIQSIFQELPYQVPVIVIDSPEEVALSITYRSHRKEIPVASLTPVKIRVYKGVTIEALIASKALKIKSYYVLKPKPKPEEEVQVYYCSE